ncbi:unnamed protein product [Calypogeia fissa]
MHRLYELFESTIGPLPLNQGHIVNSSATSSIPHLEQMNDSIFVLYDPPHPNVEIVFFHDINWNEYKQPHVETWTDDTTSICWPVDTLPDMFPKARILLTWYDAGVEKAVNGGYKRLFVVAENLRQDILPILTGECPLLLVGHGFGALVIKELVRSVQQRRDFLANTRRVRESKVTEDLLKYCDSFLENVRGAFFFAPPSLGSSRVRFTDFNKRGSLLKSLDIWDEHTAELNEWFRRWRGVKGCKVTVIWTALPSAVGLPEHVAVWYYYLTTHVVEEGNGHFDSDDSYTSHTDYFNVCKFHDKNDGRFHRLVGLIEQLEMSPCDCVGWWKMDEGSGQTCRDSSQSRADGAISGLVTWRRSKDGGSLVFDGQSMVRCGATASLEGTTPFSVSAWVKVPTSHDKDGVIIQQRGPVTYDGEYQLVIRDDGKPGFWVYGDHCNQFELATDRARIRPYTEENILIADKAINDNQWHFVLAVRDDIGGRIYVDGNMSGSAAGIARPLELKNKVFIGYDALAKAGWFQGSLSDVRIYNRALTDIEITDHYQMRTQAFETLDAFSIARKIFLAMDARMDVNIGK